MNGLPQQEAFVQRIGGKETGLFYLTNGKLQAAFTNYGARLVSLLVPDKNGQLRDVVLGLDSVDAYQMARSSFLGSTVGRYANRIAFGKFSLDGVEYNVPQNLPPHHLHGGFNNFQEQVWNAAQPDEATIVFTYTSPDGEEGFPGNVQVTATYQLTDRDELKITYSATTDKPTVINLTNHAYFNLNGQGSGTVLQHQLEINAAAITEADATSIPTGRLMPVEGTPFDFRTPQTIGSRIDADNEQIRFGSGYDHNFVLNKSAGNELSFAARAVGDESGISMEVYTTEPGMQLYTANFLKGDVRLRSGAMDVKNCGFCLETQHFPDSPNRPEFPTTRLDPGDTFRSETVYRFS
ncbi:aldose epimerase family protein [Paracnuella aquatica]|uniref:aldose epimerase family protein n=1 Tax=Paracnuella aquatica TaxID=2268757 RepID=UPI000DF008D8|nr:aldose epimerase family protein [Paracnuella aquatica]RPD47443.1 galactose mutarotase [Paracnuella aquatica]